MFGSALTAIKATQKFIQRFSIYTQQLLQWQLLFTVPIYIIIDFDVWLNHNPSLPCAWLSPRLLQSMLP
jgi:hypothetical protein